MLSFSFAFAPDRELSPRAVPLAGAIGDLATPRRSSGPNGSLVMLGKEACARSLRRHLADRPFLVMAAGRQSLPDLRKNMIEPVQSSRIGFD
jgi:hypothetical protein